MSHRAGMKRNDILDTASLLFARHGYQGTNIRLLAREAQASTSTIYTYFRDKTDLLNQSVERRLEAIEAEHLARIEALEDPVEALLQGISLLNSAVAEDPLLSSLLVYDSRVADVRISRHSRRVLQRIDDHSVALIQDAVDQGILAFDDPVALVAVFRSAFQGWLLNRVHGEKQISLEQLTRTIKRLILELIDDE
jgi:AcrR family transcriptional regulator